MGFVLPRLRQWPAFLADFTARCVVSCTFPFVLVALIGATKFIHVPGVARYDLLFVLCVAVQLLMVKLRLETWRDAAVVAVFHLLGLALEVYKVNQGSWSYPEACLTSIAGAPLYSGFMHGSVASFMCLAWKRFDLRSTGWPASWLTGSAAALVYLQFFWPQWPMAVRILMLGGVFIVFWRTTVQFSSLQGRWTIPMPLAFGLIGTMIWVAENIATYLGAWQYPYQADGWVPVHWGKTVSWTLLMMVSLVLVAEYKRRQGQLLPRASEPALA